MFARPHAIHNQVGYVTNNMEAAIALLQTRYAMPGFFRISPERSSASLPSGEKLELGLTRINGVEIELIEPIGDTAPLFRDRLPPEDELVIRFHHLCFRIEGDLENWRTYERSLDFSRHPIVLAGHLADDLRFLYTDERSLLGHYVEHVWMSPDLLDQMNEAIPTYPRL